MTDPPDPLSLPKGLRSAGDPVDANPFPERDERYRAWADATRVADAKLHEFRSRMAAQRTGSAETFLPWLSELVAGVFDVWAERNVAVVWGDGARRDHANWLAEYAASWLRDAREIKLGGLSTETVLVELRIRLVERVEHWKGEAAQHLLQQEDQAVAAKTAQPVSASVVRGTSTPGPANVFRREGDGWLVAFDGKQAWFKNLRGMEQLQTLLASPNKEFSAFELLKRTVVAIDKPTATVTGYGDADPVLDAPALREHRADIERLQHDMELAREAGSKDRENELEEELLQIAERTRKDTDRQGRPRRLGSEAERARQSASTMLNRARKRIRTRLPDLAGHLDEWVQTGGRVCYRPDIDIEWLT